MGKRKNIYFKDDDIILKLEQEENSAELISNLLKDHYNQSLEFLQQKKEDLQTEVKLVQMKIENILRVRNLNIKISNEETLLFNENGKRKEIIEKIKYLNLSGKISDDDYFSLFDNGKLNIEKAEKLL